MNKPSGASGTRPDALFLSPEAPYPPIGGGAAAVGIAARVSGAPTNGACHRVPCTRRSRSGARDSSRPYLAAGCFGAAASFQSRRRSCCAQCAASHPRAGLRSWTASPDLSARSRCCSKAGNMNWPSWSTSGARRTSGKSGSIPSASFWICTTSNRLGIKAWRFTKAFCTRLR